MNLATLPPNAPFLDSIAAEWLARHGDANGLILLPTRRAARALAEAFLRASNGKPLLLPRITAIGALDEAPLALSGALALPPAVEPAHRLAALARLVMALPQEHLAGAADRAWRLARELALLMDQAERAELDLREALRHAAAAEHASHWQVTLDFLAIVTEVWPHWLADQGLANPAARQVLLLNAQAEAWTETPPSHPVWTVGMQGGIPAVARLLRAVAGLEQGQVVLPGLDLTLADAVWEALDDPHPQAGLRTLLAGLGATRGDVARWPATTATPDARVALLSRALLPAMALGDWRTEPDLPQSALDGLYRLEIADQQEEAVAIAMILRNALEQPGHRAALVTPDRALAGRVSAELQRWGVLADDSAGEPLSHTPPAVFLRLLAATIADQLGPVSLLALLKHPFAAAGMAPAACRAAARALERACLRGPRPPAGLTGLRIAVARVPEAARAPLAGLLDRLESCLAPMLRQSVAMAPTTLLATLVETAEALAATDARPGPAILWAHEEGEALATALAGLLPHLALLPDQPPAVLPGLLDALLEGEVVRSRRVLRGRASQGEHPRIFIWGLLEAQLQSVDVVILGGLVEGIWPPATDPGPWLSRPMRARAGLPSAEVAVGLAAHDFTAAACAAPVAVLSCPRRLDGAPAVPARWLVRLEAMLAGQGVHLPPHPAAAWAGQLDQPAQVQRLSPPTPRPAVALRPRRLSVTEIATWLADPYAIYAKHVLGLRKLDPLEQATDAADYGTVVHDGLHRFLDEHGARWPAGAAAKLRAALEAALARAQLRPALAEWWRPRLWRIADWVAAIERDRRSAAPLTALVTEVTGHWHLAVPGSFHLTGRADRIERRTDGMLAILDYKTGAPPSHADVQAGFAAQLLLEAAMAQDGAFADMTGEAGELAYWHLTGGFEPGHVRPLFKGDPTAIADAVADARARLRDLVIAFDDPAQPYLSQPHAGRVPRFSDYGQLARVAEWDVAGEGDEE
ncbi:MAG: double-strand break repair protein AddB [Acetobacteraceae bacterium]|nr:double-strand break repair protein AddB [Acetobacteraceae bacterium]